MQEPKNASANVLQTKSVRQSIDGAGTEREDPRSLVGRPVIVTVHLLHPVCLSEVETESNVGKGNISAPRRF